MEAEHELGRHADLDRQVGRLTELLDGLQRGQELRVAGRRRGVEVDGIDTDLGHHAGDVEHVLTAGLGHLHLRLAGAGDVAPGQQVGRVGDGPVGAGVETEVGHRPVEDGDGRAVQRLFDAGRFQGDDRLDRLERVVGVADLHGVEAEGALEDAESLLTGAGGCRPRSRAGPSRAC